MIGKPRAKDCRQPLAARKGKEIHSPLKPQKGHRLAGILFKPSRTDLEHPSCSKFRRMCCVKMPCGYLLRRLETKVSEVQGAVLTCGEAEVGGSVSPRHIWTNSETLYQKQEDRPRKAAKEKFFKLQGKDVMVVGKCIHSNLDF